MSEPVLPGMFESRVEPMPRVTPERDRILQQLEQKQRESFMQDASTVILVYLGLFGPTSGEVLTEACKNAGITPSGDDRAFGPVYMALAKQKLIEKVGTVPRAKGHRTSGGNVWRRK
jgi:hypothetical protein